MFERYVNFEFYKQSRRLRQARKKFERYVNFEFYKQPRRSTRPHTSLRDM